MESQQNEQKDQKISESIHTIELRADDVKRKLGELKHIRAALDVKKQQVDGQIEAIEKILDGTFFSTK